VRPEVKDQPRPRKARDLLAQAREDYRTQQYLCCLDRLEHLATNYGDLPEGAQAVQLAGEIKSNPEWMKQACDSLSDRLSVLYLSLADTWLKNGQPHQAVIYLERIVQAFPGTRQAETAQLRLLQIQGQPTRPVDFKDSGVSCLVFGPLFLVLCVCSVLSPPTAHHHWRQPRHRRAVQHAIRRQQELTLPRSR
jgi:hypothetical protein